MCVLDRWAREQIRQGEKDKMKLEVSAEEVKASRLTSQGIRALRERLVLTQKEMAVLTGSTSVAVGSWEKGKHEPRGEKKAALVALRKLGKRDVKKVLEKKRGESRKNATVKKKVKARSKKRSSGKTKGRK